MNIIMAVLGTLIEEIIGVGSIAFASVVLTECLLPDSGLTFVERILFICVGLVWAIFGAVMILLPFAHWWVG